MYRFKTIAMILLLTLTGSIATWAAQEQARPAAAAAAAADQSAPQVGEPRRRTFPGVTYFYTSGETTLRGLPEHIRQMMPAAANAVEESHARVVGAPLLVYHSTRSDPDAKFTVDIGFPVAEGTAAPAAGPFKVKKLPPFRCVSLLYTGPISGLAAAYERLAATAPGGKPAAPAEESRQMMLYWEGEESPNNVLQIMIGLR
jgi:hypothetical protein